MKNLKVSNKLILGFLIVALLTAVVGVVGIYGLTQMSNASDDLYSVASPLYELAMAIDAFQRSRTYTVEIIIYTGRADNLRGVEADLNEALETFSHNMDVYYDSLRTAETQSLWAKIMDDFNRVIKPGMLDVLAGAKQGEEVYVLRESMYGMDSAADALVDDLEQLINLRDAFMDDSNTSNMALGDRLLYIIIGVIVVALVIAIALALYISSIISKPLGNISRALDMIGTRGDLDMPPDIAQSTNEYASYRDEIGITSKAFVGVVGRLTNVAQVLEKLSDGDLTTDIALLSNADTMGKSLKQMLDNLNRMFAEIQASTSQVSTGSKQVADGAQSLAQGSTEQAASVQQLSSSISEIAQMTKENAMTAERTLTLSNTIKDSAEKGSRQMNEMITAVGEINEASKSISKIIKTIDDIAFQTNILALNAAVEAARAGQHGKGFAVVAEEVRNLASKSAEAAKDTGNMIQNSMDKAELGSRIAGETAASLNEIVTGINESSQLIEEITRSSESQSSGISQINIGIDQVTQVVQQNSATAEESAAASEEMSGQSDMLQQLIAQFRLRDSGTMYQSLPQARMLARKAAPKPESTEYGIADIGGDFGKY